MVKGRPRKPTNVLELNGAFKEHPKRKKARQNEPSGGAGLGPYPGSRVGMSEEDAYNIIRNKAPQGVLTEADEEHVMLIARLMFLSWNDACTASERHLLAALLGKIGMNPSDRSRLQVSQEKKPKNRWGSESKLG